MRRKLTRIGVASVAALTLTTSMALAAHARDDKALIALGMRLLARTIVGVATVNRGEPEPASLTILSVPAPLRWVPGYWQTEWTPNRITFQVPVPGHHDSYGNWVPGHHQTGVIETSATTQVWVPGHWE